MDVTPDAQSDPLARLAALPGVPEAVDAARTAVDRVTGHRAMRRRAADVAAEAALRGARASAALDGASWALEEVRRRTDFGPGAGEGAATVGAALRLVAEVGGASGAEGGGDGSLAGVWRGSPLRVLARLHLVAAGGTVPDEAVGRPRRDGEAVAEPGLARLAAPPPGAAEVSARLGALAVLVVAGSGAPVLVTAAVVHGELLALRPFRTHNALVARAAARLALVAGGLDPKAVAPAEVGHAELGAAAYLAAADGYASGTAEGVAAWLAHCGRAVELGARESVAVCEALQRGAGSAGRPRAMRPLGHYQ
jgi:hypothetical protein